MKSWQKVGILTLVVLIAVGIRIYFIYRERHQPAPQPQVAQPQLTRDDTVIPRKMYIDSIASAKALDGKTVWVQSGYALDYYPYADRRVQFDHPAGVLPSVQALQIQDIVTEKTPAKIATRIPKGDKQVFAVFTMPNEPGKTYATAVGFFQGTDSTFYCDQIFYYDDPHQMYSYWGPKIWAAIDQHHPIPGMNELQTALALGTIQQSQSSQIGNRTVDYIAGNQKWSVTFQDDKATTIKQDQTDQTFSLHPIRYSLYPKPMPHTFTTSYLEDARAIFHYYKKLADGAIAQVSDADLTRTLDPEMNSIAIVMKHLSGNMLSRWTDFLTTDGEKSTRNRDGEFENPPASRAELLALWERGWDCLFHAIDPLTEADLARSVTIRGEAHSVTQAINRQIAHISYHVGQIVLLAKHFQSASWKSLSVPRGQSQQFTEKVRSGQISQR